LPEQLENPSGPREALDAKGLIQVEARTGELQRSPRWKQMFKNDFLAARFQNESFR
jgi:hypothetical protein